MRADAMAGGSLMLVERAELTIRPGMAEAFQTAFREKGVPLLAAAPGVKWVKFGRGVENPEKAIILVEWESMAAHTAFGGLPIRDEFLAVIMPFSIGGVMEHFEIEW